jgi:hypothetical protein
MKQAIFSVIFVLVITAPLLVEGIQLSERVKHLEAAQGNAITLPREHWVCVDVLRDGDGMVECKTWENIGGKQ